jgi:hypothetical protein
MHRAEPLRILRSNLERIQGLSYTISTSNRSMKTSDHELIWSLWNAFTSAFKALEPIPQFKATAKLGEFLETRFSQSF